MSLNFCMLKNVDGGDVAINPATVATVRPAGARETSLVAYAGGEVKVTGVVGEVVLKLLAAARASVPLEGRTPHVPPEERATYLAS